MCVLNRPPTYLVLRALFALLLVTAPIVDAAGPVVAQETSESATPTGDAITESVPDEADLDGEIPAEVQTDPAPDEPEITPANPTGDDSPPAEDAPTEEPATDVPEPPVPDLAYEPNAPASCLPVSGDPSEPVAAGEDLEYSCSFSISLQGANVDPAALVLDWSVSATVGGDWGVQLLDPTGDPSAWTEPGLSSAAIGSQTSYSVDTSTGPLESLQDAAAIQFGLLLHRPVCATDPITLEVDVAGTASIPSSDRAVVTSNTAQPLVASITPALADVDMSLPAVSIVDILVDPVGFSLTDTRTHGSLTIQVDNPTLQCRPSNVLVAIQPTAGSAIADAAFLSVVGSLQASTVTGAAPDASGEGSSLDAPVVVSSVQTGAEAGSYQQTIEFELTIPGATGAGLYQLGASAVVEPAE